MRLRRTALLNWFSVNMKRIALVTTTLLLTLMVARLVGSADPDPPARRKTMADRHHLLYGTVASHAADAPFETPDGLLVCLSCHEVDTCTGQILIERNCRTCHQPNNNEPVAADDSYIMEDNSTLHVPVLAGVLRNDSDADGDSLAASLVGDVSFGTLKLLPYGDFLYRPQRDFVGDDSFTYVAHDGLYNSDVARVTIIVDVDIKIVIVDIMPESSQNLTNLCSTGALPVNIPGSAACDVTEINVSSLLLEGQVAPLRWRLEGEGDGYKDLNLEFDSEAVNNTLRDMRVGQMREVRITGALMDGTPIMGSDFIFVVASSRLNKGGQRP